MNLTKEEWKEIHDNLFYLERLIKMYIVTGKNYDEAMKRIQSIKDVIGELK